MIVFQQATNWLDAAIAEQRMIGTQAIPPVAHCAVSCSRCSHRRRVRSAAAIAAQGVRLEAEFTIQPADIVSGNEKLNMAFVAGLFNCCPALEPPKETELQVL